MNYWDFLNLQAKHEIELHQFSKKQNRQMRIVFFVLIAILLAVMVWLALFFAL
jgi:predicted nucleic acid-binding Zn ribbon protein